MDDEELRERAGGKEVVEFMESNGFMLTTSGNSYGYWFNQDDQMTEGLGQAKYMFNLIKSRDQQIALEAEIKIHDEYWHSQKYVEEHGIGSLALANKEATELKLRSLKQPQGNTHE